MVYNRTKQPNPDQIQLKQAKTYSESLKKSWKIAAKLYNFRKIVSISDLGLHILIDN